MEIAFEPFLKILYDQLELCKEILLSFMCIWMYTEMYSVNILAEGMELGIC